MTLAWGARVSAEFRRRVIAIAIAIGIDPSWLMACIAFETGATFSPSMRNPLSGATGLIQFMPSTAELLGATVDELAAMSAEDQLSFVEKYFEPYAGKLHTLADCYMAILWPKAIGEPEDEVIFAAGSKAFLQNSGLDLDHDGEVTKAECAAFVAKRLEQGFLPENVSDLVPERPPLEEAAPSAPPAPQPSGDAMGAIALPLLAQLLPQVLGLFSGRAQAQIAKATGADPAIAGQFMQSLITKVGSVAGVAVKDDATAIQAVSAVTALAPEEKAARARELEAHALELLAPALDKLAGYDKDRWAAEIAGRNAAAARAAQERYDSAPTLVWSSVLLISIILVALLAVLGVQVYQGKDPTVILALLGPLLGYAFKAYSELYAYRFDGTKESAAQTAIIGELSKK